MPNYSTYAAMRNSGNENVKEKTCLNPRLRHCVTNLLMIKFTIYYYGLNLNCILHFQTIKCSICIDELWPNKFRPWWGTMVVLDVQLCGGVNCAWIFVILKFQLVDIIWLVAHCCAAIAKRNAVESNTS